MGGFGSSQGGRLGLFSLAKLFGSGQNDKNLHRLVRFGFAHAGQDFWEKVAVAEAVPTVVALFDSSGFVIIRSPVFFNIYSLVPKYLFMYINVNLCAWIVGPSPTTGTGTGRIYRGTKVPLQHRVSVLVVAVRTF